jgi:hypothetical protein
MRWLAVELDRRAFLPTAASAARILGAKDRIRLAGIGVRVETRHSYP